jgi:hypothetical protein
MPSLPLFTGLVVLNYFIAVYLRRVQHRAHVTDDAMKCNQ